MTTKIEINFSEQDLCKEWSKWIHKYGLGVKVKLQGNGIWCSYLSFCDKISYFEKVAKTKKLDFLWKNVDNSGGVLSELPWHSGVTFVEKTITDKGQRRILIGDDYAHYWDEEFDYSLEHITHNITNIAEKCYSLLKEKGINEESENA